MSFEMHLSFSHVAKKHRRKFLIAAACLVTSVALLSACADSIIRRSSEGKLFSSCISVPPRDVALVLGTSPTFKGGPNPFYEARLDAAAELFKNGKVRGIIVSGDNSTAYYNEPRDMRNDLITRGIPSQYITCDFAGLRTLDSIQRAGCVFGQTRIVVVSQSFHLERALYIAQAEGLDAVGFVAADAPLRWWLRARVREILARDVAVLDRLIGREPRHLGQREFVSLAPTPNSATLLFQ